MTSSDTFTTRGGFQVKREKVLVDYDKEIVALADKLDTHLGCLLSSSYEYPNRYKRWDLGLVDPMLVIWSRAYKVTIKALNDRGRGLPQCDHGHGPLQQGTSFLPS